MKRTESAGVPFTLSVVGTDGAVDAACGVGAAAKSSKTLLVASENRSNGLLDLADEVFVVAVVIVVVGISNAAAQFVSMDDVAAAPEVAQEVTFVPILKKSSTSADTSGIVLVMRLADEVVVVVVAVMPPTSTSISTLGIRAAWSED